jgi:radical SAM superfamily enzyme YgiQ (UPF0313 family)
VTDILLTHGYFLAEDPIEGKVMKPYPPLGLLYISSHLKRAGFSVEIQDSTFLNKADALARIVEKRPKIVGIYANLMTRGHALEIAQAAKAAGAHVILGGPEPVNYAEEYLSRGADIVVSGEGETTLAELVPHLGQHGLAKLDLVAGIAYLGDDGTVRRTAPRVQIADLDAQPFPDRGAIDLELYLSAWKTHHGVRSVSLITARGCVYSCNWCSHSVFGHSHRRRSPANVADEIELIRDVYAPDQLWYADDVFTINQKWLEGFAAEMKRRGLHYPFETITREDRLNPRIAELLAELGCYRIWIGAESGSQKILDAMQRKTNAARMREMIALVKSKGIRAGTFIMLGYDSETWEDIDETARHLRASAPDDVLTTISYPIKGTPYYDKVADRLSIPAQWDQSSDRLITVKGRKSRRFYRHAQQWLAAESRLGKAAELGLARRIRLQARSALSRLAMYATRHEVEHG